MFVLVPLLSLVASPAARAANGVQVVVTTADGVRRLDAEADLPLMPHHDGPGAVITIDRDVRGQSILGMGASFDHASCENLARLSPERRAEVIEMLFHPRRGLGMNLMRVCIGTSDFTGVPYYTYDDMPAGQTDPDLAAFSIAADREHVIPAIRAAREINPDLLLYASPWSPPAWMKKPERLGGGSVEPRWYPAYARYLLAFLRAYEAEGLQIHALTVQNEPHMTHPGYPTTAWTAAAQRDFIRDHLGPLLEREGVKTLIWCWDHNWNEPEFPRMILADPAAARFVDGTAFHHYEGDVAAQGMLHDEFPAKHIYFTEGSTFGVRGAETMVSILRNWSRSYNFWVFLLDEHQRPNRGPHDATPTCLELLDDGSVRTNIDCHVYAQFMRHIPRGAVRVASTVPAGGPANVAFEDAAGRIVHVIVNPTRQQRPLRVLCGGRMVSATLPPESVVTHLWPAAD